jgi:hypothetical protein
MPVPPETSGNRANIVKMGQLALRNEKVLSREVCRRVTAMFCGTDSCMVRLKPDTTY